MADVPQITPGVAPNRLNDAEYAMNFTPASGPMSSEEARIAAERCLFCVDAPCVAACPTGIDVPAVLEQILSDDLHGAARTVLDQNILGGICARVCPSEELCEAACIYGTRNQPSVDIARLHRFATDALPHDGPHPYQRATPTGRKVAVIGAGPAGLACAHRLALSGHDVTLMDARAKPGGLSEYGIAAYKLEAGFAAAEIDWLLGIGGISFVDGVHLGHDLTLETLRERYDAVFLGMGLAGVNALKVQSPRHDNVTDAVDFIAALRQADDLSTVPVGRDVVVLGGGRTALEAAVQARLLGAETVTIAYRDSRADMESSQQERLHATSKGVRIITGATPIRLLGNGPVEAVEFTVSDPTHSADDGAGGRLRLKADQVLTAIGQHLEGAPGGLQLKSSRIAVDDAGRTSQPGVWAGGDCTSRAGNLTVCAVAQGRDAAMDMHETLSAPTG